jgi:hypothetical protein
MENNNKEGHSLFIDKPRDRSKLVLGFPNYIDTICNFILHSEPRFTVGIFGEWGSGKSTLLENIKRTLEEQHSCTCAIFDAWKYEYETTQIAIPLILTIIAEIYKKNKERIDELEDQENSENQSTKEKIDRVVSGLSLNMKVGIPGLGDIGLGYDFSKINDYNQRLGFPTLRSKIEKFSLEQTKIHEGIDLIDNLVTKNPAVKGPKESEKLKLVLFIDDLDRCTPKKAAQIFEAIKVFLDKPGIVYVLGLSNKVLEKAIEINYYHFKNEIKGKDYLKKVFQLPIKIPLWERNDIEELIDSLMEEYEDDEFKKFFKSYRKLISQGVESNPREIIRFLNTYILNYQILSDAKNIDKVKLMTIQAIRLRWEWLYDAIISDKSILEEIKKYLLDDHSKPPEKSMAEAVKQNQQLANFLMEQGKIIFEIEKEEWQNYRGVAYTTEVQELIKNKNNREYYSALISDFQTLDEENENHKGKLKEIWNLVAYNEDFAGNLGYSLGPNFTNLNDKLRAKVWSLAKQNDAFAGGLGSSLGREFMTFEKEIKEKAWELAEQNDAFSTQLSYALGRDFRTLDQETITRMFEVAQKRNVFAGELGAALGRDFKTVYDRAKDKVWDLVPKNETFAVKLGYSIGENIASLDKQIQDEIWDLAKKNSTFAAKLGYFIGRNFVTLDRDLQMKVLKIAEDSDAFAADLGSTLGRDLRTLDPKVKEKVFDLVEQKQKFAEGLGKSLGRIFGTLDKETQQGVRKIADRNKKFRDNFVKFHSL